MKRMLHNTVRAMGLLKAVDNLMYARNLAKFRASNHRFVSAHPDFPVPPADLAFDAYNHVDWNAYSQIGARHAGVYADIIREVMPEGPLAVLEWGCGPGRLIRHMSGLLDGYAVSLSGSDVNRRSISWCRENLPGIAFFANDFSPPIAMPDGSFDVIYNFSVFTHLSEQQQKDWARELWRLLRPGGIFISSTHGDYYKTRLGDRGDEAQYDNGRVVVKTNYEEGKKWYLAIHPDAYVRDELLRPFAEVRKISPGSDAQMRHDLWVARKADTSPAADAANTAAGAA